LAANAYSKKAVSKIFKLKKRPSSNPLIVHYHNINQLKKDCELNSVFRRLYKKFCPGAISFVLKLKKTSKISKIVTNNSNLVAVRFPSHHLTRKILKEIDYPLAAPSANISSSISPVSKQDVIDEFGNKIKFVLEGGSSKVGLESTIINLVGKPNILRLGGIDSKTIYKFIKSSKNNQKREVNVKMPGSSKLHYSPGIPMRLNVKKNNDDEAFILIKKRKKKNKIKFLNKSCAPSATATPNSPSPAIIGPILIPQSSKTAANPRIIIKTFRALIIQLTKSLESKSLTDFTTVEKGPIIW